MKTNSTFARRDDEPKSDSLLKVYSYLHQREKNLRIMLYWMEKMMGIAWEQVNIGVLGFGSR